MFAEYYKKLTTDFSKISFFILSLTLVLFLYNAKNFNLDASSDALLLESDKDLKYL